MKSKEIERLAKVFFKTSDQDGLNIFGAAKILSERKEAYSELLECEFNIKEFKKSMFSYEKMHVMMFKFNYLKREKTNAFKKLTELNKEYFQFMRNI